MTKFYAARSQSFVDAEAPALGRGHVCCCVEAVLETCLRGEKSILSRQTKPSSNVLLALFSLFAACVTDAALSAPSRGSESKRRRCLSPLHQAAFALEIAPG